MEGKDNRSKEKRSKMKQHYNRKAATATKRSPIPGAGGNTSSSSTQLEAVRSVVDVADSSDDRFATRRGWLGAAAGKQDQSLNDFEDETDNAQLQAGDFDMMSRLPAAAGGHFKFAAEKQWDAPEPEQLMENTEANEYFTLNLKQLNMGLQTIPFYKRMDYASSMFTNDQLRIMEEAAEKAEINYQHLLKEHEGNPHIKVENESRQNSAAKTPAPAKPPPPVDDELDELLNMTTDQVAKVELANTPPVTVAADSVTLNADSNKEDIQKWLDNVLEE